MRVPGEDVPAYPAPSTSRRPVLPLGCDEPALPAPPDLVARLAGAASRTVPEPVAGGVSVRTAAAGWFERRGLPTDPDRVVFAPGSRALLFALMAAVSGDVLLSRPCWPGYAAQAALLGRRVHRVPTPAECGGVPDPFALLEVVRRVKEAGGVPGLVVLTVPDDPTGTIPPPELLREVGEAARDSGLVVLSDELHRELTHAPNAVVISPAEILPERTVVTTGLSASHALGGWRTGLARFPQGAIGDDVLRRVLTVAATVWGSPPVPVAEAVAYAWTEPSQLRAHLTAVVRTLGAVTAEVYRVVTEAGALCHPPEAGFHLYPDLAPLRAQLAARGVIEAAGLERYLLTRWGMAVLGGHRFGDDPSSLRFRLSTGRLYGRTEAEQRAALSARDPLRLASVADALARIREGFADLAAQ